MIEIQFTYPYPVQGGALDNALREAYPGKILGVSTYGQDMIGQWRAVSIWVEDDTTLEQQTEIQRIAADHDPIFITVEKPEMKADGKSENLVTVQAPRHSGPHAVVLEMAWLRKGSPVWENAEEWLIQLDEGTGQDHIIAYDPGTICLRVKNGANRSTEVRKVLCL
jgi:hypothetical protein